MHTLNVVDARRISESSGACRRPYAESSSTRFIAAERTEAPKTMSGRDHTEYEGGKQEYRTSISLDGNWTFVTDPNTAGRTNEWYEPHAEWPERAQSVEVPFVWEEREQYQEYTGTGWFRRSFTLDDIDTRDRDLLLEFGAVDYETTVWVNGEYIGENRGGYLPFSFDITDELVNGTNTIVLAVTDPSDLSEIPHGKQGDPWYTRVSGIWQSVRLSALPTTRIDDLRVTPQLETDTATVAFDVAPTDATDELEVRFQVRREGEQVLTERTEVGDGSTVVLDFEDPEYWTPESPVLYDIHATLERNGRTIDRYSDYFGIRSFEADDDQFLLNGEPLTLRGVLDQGYYPETLYRPPSDEMFEREVTLADELGFNLIRKHIKPAHPEFLEYADRHGMLVWEEPANPTVYTKRSRSEVRTQLMEMIDRDYNHPSVVIWSLYNEEWGIGHHDSEETLWTDREKQQFLVDLYRDVSEYDPSRLVCDNSGWAHVATDINDFHRYFVSPEQATEWAADLDHISAFAADNYATDEFDDTGGPIVISELGTWGISDIDQLRDRYGGDPNWFHHDFLVEPLKSPAEVDERFQNSDLHEVFDDYGDLASVWQEREFESVKHLLKEMRTRDSIAGYVLTELSDIEWEFNGLLDYHREPKGFLDRFTDVNGPITAYSTPESHIVWADEPMTVEVSIVNDTTSPHSGDLSTLFGEVVSNEPVTVPANETVRLERTVKPTTTASGGIETRHFTVTFEAADIDVSTSEPITVVDETVDLPELTVFAEGEFASRLAQQGVTVTHRLSDTVDIAIIRSFSNEVEQFASRGGTVVQVPKQDGEMASGGPFTYRSIPRTESWNVVASFFYQDTPLLDGLCQDRGLGWAFEGVYPYAVATDLDPSVDRTHASYIEGWLAEWGSPLVVRGYGQGSITALTFRVGTSYGNHPGVTVLCNRLLSRLG